MTFLSLRCSITSPVTVAPFNQRAAMGEIFAVAMKEDIAEDGFLAGFAFEQIDIDDVTFCDAMLSAACFDNCVSHTKSWVNCLWGKAAQSPTVGEL